jgi:hypothetical protein
VTLTSVPVASELRLAEVSQSAPRLPSYGGTGRTGSRAREERHPAVVQREGRTSAYAEVLREDKLRKCR